MIILVIVGIAIAALGVLLAALGIAVACMQDKGRRCAYRRPRAAVILARDLWDSLRSGTAFLPPAPMQAIVPDAGVLARANWETIRAGMLTAQPAEDNPPAPEPNPWDDGPDPEPYEPDEADDWPQTAALAGEHPYPPLPVTLPRPDGDVRIDERGHVTVRRREPVAHPTLYDLPAVQGRPYALAMGPDGCEEVR